MAFSAKRSAETDLQDGKTEPPALRKYHWTSDEDLSLLLNVHNHKRRDTISFDVVASLMPGRNAVDCFSRWEWSWYPKRLYLKKGKRPLYSGPVDGIISNGSTIDVFCYLSSLIPVRTCSTSTLSSCPKCAVEHDSAYLLESPMIIIDGVRLAHVFSVVFDQIGWVPIGCLCLDLNSYERLREKVQYPLDEFPALKALLPPREKADSLEKQENGSLSPGNNIPVPVAPPSPVAEHPRELPNPTPTALAIAANAPNTDRSGTEDTVKALNFHDDMPSTGLSISPARTEDSQQGKVLQPRVDISLHESKKPSAKTTPAPSTIAEVTGTADRLSVEKNAGAVPTASHSGDDDKSLLVSGTPMEEEHAANQADDVNEGSEQPSPTNASKSFGSDALEDERHDEPCASESLHRISEDLGEKRAFPSWFSALLVLSTCLFFIAWLRGVQQDFVKITLPPCFFPSTIHPADTASRQPMYSRFFPRFITEVEPADAIPSFQWCNHSEEQIPCPPGGVCRNGQLRSCQDTFRVVSLDGDQCIFSPVAIDTLASVKARLSQWTAKYYCDIRGKEWGSKIDLSAPWFDLSLLVEKVPNVEGVLLSSDAFFFESREHEEKTMITLTDEYMRNHSVVPSWCQFRILVIQFVEHIEEPLLRTWFVVLISFKRYPLMTCTICLMTVLTLAVCVTTCAAAKGLKVLGTRHDTRRKGPMEGFVDAPQADN